MFKFIKKIIIKIKESIFSPIKKILSNDYYLTPFEYSQRLIGDSEYYDQAKEMDKLYEYRAVLNRVERKLEELNLSSLFSRFNFHKTNINLYPRLVMYKKENTGIVLLTKSDYDVLVRALKEYLNE